METTGGNLVDNFLEMAPVYWDRMTTNTTPEGLVDAVRDLDARIQQMARLRGYLDTRFSYPNDGPREHSKAVKESNRLVREVRRALGFAQPKADVSF